MSNFMTRFTTSIPLISLIYIALINKIILFFLLITLGFLILLELFNLKKKIFINNYKIIVFLYLISIFYISFFFTQLYFFVIFDFNNKLLFIFLLSICIATDLGGFVFGKLLKGKKLTKISPNKTYSGLVGSYLFSLIIFAIFYFYFSFSIKFIILTVLISSISQLGDLLISLLKRKAKVKDTGNILPGHGGILDRIDGIIFALPIGINVLVFFQ